MGAAIGRRAVLALAPLSLPRMSSATGHDRIRTSHRLRIAINEDDAPFSFRRADGELDGLDLHVSLALASLLDCEPVLVPGRGTASLLAILDDGRADVIVSGMIVSPLLARRLRFARPTATRPLVVATRRDADITSATGLRGRAVAVSANWRLPVVEQLARRWSFTIEEVRQHADAVAALRDGRVGAALLDGYRLREQLGAMPWPDLREIFEVLSLPVAPAVPLQEPRLVALLDEAIGVLEANGTLEVLVDQFLAPLRAPPGPT